MKYIRACLNCGKDMRFPLDRGILLIKCPHCNESFKMDPDDPFTYKNGRFELVNIKTAYKPNFTRPIYSNILNNFSNPLILKKIIVFILVLLTIVHLYRFSNSIDTDFNTPSEEKKQIPIEKKSENDNSIEI
jgi:DNA-directed RNA polymerase subunit RPC12/RpoP